MVQIKLSVLFILVVAAIAPVVALPALYVIIIIKLYYGMIYG